MAVHHAWSGNGSSDNPICLRCGIMDDGSVDSYCENLKTDLEEDDAEDYHEDRSIIATGFRNYPG